MIEDESPASRNVASTAADAPGIDTTTTASLPDEAEGPDGTEGNALLDERAEQLALAHVDWCSRRYRSYDPRDNGYNPYRGGRRECVSPYLEEMEALAAPLDARDEYGNHEVAWGEDEGYSYVADAGTATGYLDEDHVRACFARYRSYDARDNSYQPYGGGPRRQCE